MFVDRIQQVSPLYHQPAWRCRVFKNVERRCLSCHRPASSMMFSCVKVCPCELRGLCFVHRTEGSHAARAFPLSPFGCAVLLSSVRNCDPNNPNVWCSLGVLYYQLHQNRDALDAYTRAIKLDPHLCEVCQLNHGFEHVFVAKINFFEWCQGVIWQPRVCSAQRTTCARVSD